ncbi:MAG: hypothetical protein EOO24_08660, partial [Comamonadaceae bacterium]
MNSRSSFALAGLLGVALVGAGCNSLPGRSQQAAGTSASSASAPAEAARNGARPGMDAQGNVIDSSKVESGSG